MAASEYRKGSTVYNRQNSRFADVSLAFLPDPFTGDLVRTLDVDAVKKSVKNLILTNKNERILNPEIGSNLRGMLFEPISSITATVLEDLIKETIKNFEPRAVIQAITISPNIDQNAYDVTIVFRVVSVEQTVVIDILLERIR